jgi:plasmid stabilization system protein ParE
MTTLLYAPELAADFARIVDHLEAHDVADVDVRIGEIVAALQVLRMHPLIGRPAGGHWRELVIGKGSRGYVALYAYNAVADTASVAALRAQREAGFREGL